MAQILKDDVKERISRAALIVFAKEGFPGATMSAIAREAGVKVVANLYTDTLGEAGSGVASYADMLRYDMRTIVDALR